MLIESGGALWGTQPRVIAHMFLASQLSHIPDLNQYKVFAELRSCCQGSGTRRHSSALVFQSPVTRVGLQCNRHGRRCDRNAIRLRMRARERTEGPVSRCLFKKYRKFARDLRMQGFYYRCYRPGHNICCQETRKLDKSGFGK